MERGMACVLVGVAKQGYCENVRVRNGRGEAREVDVHAVRCGDGQ